MQTTPKYYLNNQKLQYLLCVAKIAGVYAKINVFEEPIRNLKNNFAIERIADNFTRSSAIQEGIKKQIKLELTHNDFIVPYSKKRLYAIKEPINDEEKFLLIDVYLRFGAYSEEALCKLLNEIKPLRAVPVWTYINNFDLDKLLFNGEAVNNDNEILSFCSERCIVSAPDAVSSVAENIVEDAKKEERSVLAVDKPFVSLLSNYTGSCLNKMIVGRKYSLYIETSSHQPIKDVVITSENTDMRIIGTLSQLSDTLFCYSFDGAASNIKLSIDK